MQRYTYLANNELNNIGTLHNNGSIIFYDSSSSEVSTITLGNPAFGDATGGLIIANATGADSSSTGGTIDHAITYDSSGNSLMLLSVSTIDSTSSTDVKVSELTIGNGTSFSIPISPGIRLYFTPAD